MSEPPPPAAPVPAPRAGRLGRWIARGTVLLAVFVVIQSLVAEVYVVNGASMEPTLHEHERLLIWKASGTLARGDLVVFAHPFDRERVLVKRVVALEGERVELRGGRVFVDDRELGEPYLDRTASVSPRLGERPAAVVPAGTCFVLGDNRANSQDSRAFGPLELPRVVGRAVAVLWPPRRLP